MKELKNYLHLYLGCECVIGDSNVKETIKAVSEYSVCVGANKYGVDDQFILGQDGKYAWRATFFPSMFKYLLSKYFDLFGLIEAGLAIQKRERFEYF
jgi:hypothetical protein